MLPTAQLTKPERVAARYDSLMNGTINHDVAKAAVALHRSHPQAPELEILELVVRGRTGSLRDFGDTTQAGSDFGAIIAGAFDRGMSPEEWRVVNFPSADPALVAALLGIWRDEVLPAFAKHFGLAT